MKTGFKEGTADIGDEYVSRDWLISRYPEIAGSLVSFVGTAMYGGGWMMMGDGISIPQYSWRVMGTTETKSGTINDNPWVKILSRGYGGNAVLKSDGTLWVWGSNTYGALGDGTTIDKSSPIAFGASTRWKTGSSNGNNVAAIRYDGALFNTGYNDGGIGIGIVGDGTTIHRSSPVQIGTSSWTAVSMGPNFGIAIRSDGTLWGWGSSYTNGQNTQTNSPMQIGTSSWSMISAGNGIAYGIRNDGTLWRWGGSAYGANGNNTNGTTTSTPTQIGTKSNWRFVCAGSDGVNVAGAIDNDNKLYMWGSNSVGQLGDGTTINRSSPVQVGGSSWATVTIGASSTAAITVDGSLWTWGYGISGVLGDGTQSNRSSPVQIASTLRFQDAKFNAFNLLALTDGGVL